MQADNLSPADDTGGRVIIAHLSIPATFPSVRTALAALMEGPVLEAVPEGDRGAVEIVLAEALNNIVEHAYADAAGEITLTLWQAGGEVACRITDRGVSMPQETLPEGILAQADTPADLAEGGFGWFLIRSLSRDLRYARYGTLNELTFVLNSEQSPSFGDIVSHSS
jgi:serine/threonine-protein kinase RsbW